MRVAVRRRLRRLDTIALRATAIFASIFAPMLTILLVLGTLLYDRDRAELARDTFLKLTAERIAAAVSNLDDKDYRPSDTVDVMNDPTVRVRWYGDKPSFLEAEWASCYIQKERSRSECGVAKAAEAFGIADLAAAMEDKGLWSNSRVRKLYFIDDEDSPQDEDYETLLDKDRADLMPSRSKAVIAVEYRYGRRVLEYAAFVVATDSMSNGWAWRMSGRLLAAFAFVVALACLAAYAASVPVRRLSIDGPAPEAGPRETRRIARALEASQERVRYLRQDLGWAMASLTHDMREALGRLSVRIEAIGDDSERDNAEADIAFLEALTVEAYDAAERVSKDEGDRPVDLATMAQALCDSASDAGRTARYRGPDRMVLTCPPSAVRRALSNLIDNAIAYGGEADVSLSEDDEAIRVLIGDRGPGIPPAEHEAVFQPYRRLETPAGGKTGGMGLGLPIARNAVQRCGGAIELRDREGGGLEVAVTLPKR
ncbi:MAG: HAMP domain-containing histidine kinase [Alphaproteobacteria bacterium]|nr:HAMP domain-containing histidine kinase [Alphaproteobacteria bacterium]